MLAGMTGKQHLLICNDVLSCAQSLISHVEQTCLVTWLHAYLGRMFHMRSSEAKYLH
jgi:hypothetical protein